MENTHTFAIGCLAALAALAIIIGLPVVYALQDIQTNAEIGKACIAAGGSWEQNLKGIFECRKK